MIQISTENGRISAWGTQSDVKKIWWEENPAEPKRNQPLDLSPAKIMAMFDDGTSQEITDYCTFSPANGTIVSSSATEVTITAFYPARSGKTFQSSVTMPVTYPFALRVVTNPSYIAYESVQSENSPLFDSNAYPVDRSKIKVFALFAKAGGNEIIKAIEVSQNNYSITYHFGVVGIYSGGIAYDAITAFENEKTDVEVYHSLEDASIESFSRALDFTAKSTIEGQVLTSPHVFVEAIPISEFVLINVPETYDGETEFIIRNTSNIKLRYSNGVEKIPILGFDDYDNFVSGSVPDFSSVRSSLRLKLADGFNRDFYIGTSIRSGPGHQYKSTKYHVSCENGNITWEAVE